MPIPQALVTRYFQLIVSRQFTEAERELERIKQKMHNGDEQSFFSKLDLSDKAAVHGYKREFLDHTKNGLHGDFDRGYFSAWADCMRVLARMNVPSPQSSSESVKGPEEEKLETLKSDKSQATIANFLRKNEGE
jgi:hypothetical protein